MKIAITGSTGFVGSRLVERLQTTGDEMVLLVRDLPRARQRFPADRFDRVTLVPYTSTAAGDWQKALAGCDGVINLAGVSIAEGRWTAARKQAILESRVTTTERLVEAIAQINPKPAVMISTSAIGYYGTSLSACFDESSGPGQDFLAEVCQRWETAAQKVQDSQVRLAILRFGIVLANGGVIAKLLPPFQVFLGGPLGEGNQWFSWIHREDLISLILYTLKRSDMRGVINATAPNPVRIAELCQVLGEIIRRPSWLPVPGFALEVLLGEAAKLVLEGQQVMPKRALEYGFEFQYPEIRSALQQILANDPKS